MENHIGTIIEMNRKRRNWSRKYIAEKLGVNVSMISFYERGLKIPSDKKKMILCDLFNISWQELIGESPETKLRKDITQILFEMELNKNELLLIIERITEFYCNSGSYDNLKNLHIYNKTINIEKIENAITKIEDLFFSFFKEEIYKNKDRKKVIPMADISKYIQENFSNILNGIISNLNEEDILHDSFITIYEEILSNKINNELYADVQIKGYLPQPKEYTYKNIQFFGLLITKQSNMARYQYNDVVVFKKYNDYIYNTDILISMNGKLKIVRITKHRDSSFLVYTQDDDFDIYTEKQLKKNNFKIIGIPIEIKINYFNENNDI